MVKSYIIITLRNIRKHKAFTFINITGLAIGIACCLLILLWVKDELSYDRFNEKSDRLYRVTRVSGESRNQRTPAVLAPTLKAEYPEISNVCRYKDSQTFIKKEDKFFSSIDLAYVDPSFFDLFTIHFIQGNAATGLDNNSSILLTESFAKRLFGDSNPVGKVLGVGVNSDRIVTGIIKDFPDNSHLKFDCLVNFDSRDKSFENMFGKNSWRINAYSTYVLLNEETRDETVNDKIKDIIKEHHETSESEIFLQPVTDINLYPLEEEGNLKYLYIFSVIALFILTIACINFTNLSTARSDSRAKEIGMLKVIGATRFGLIKKFLGESLLLTVFSVLLACLIVVLLMPYFNGLSGKQIDLASISIQSIILIIIVITIITSILAGCYPAFYLSSLVPSAVFKKSTNSGRFKSLFRNYLVIFQFATTVILIIGVAVVYNQLSFMVNTDLGYDKEHMIFFDAPEEYINNFENIRSELLSNPNVTNAALGTPPMLLDFAINDVTWDGKNEDEEITFAKYHVSHDYINTSGLQILEGRDFSKNISTDTDNAYIINEEAERVIGFPVLNKELTITGDLVGGNGKVIGVVHDFHSSFHEKIVPTILDIDNNWVNSVIVRINGKDIANTIKFLEEKWKTRIINRPFDYSFFDDEIDNFYKKENQMAKLLGSFSVLAIIIACLGLFGLVTFVTEQRTKEIGIRKVLGSTILGIILLLAKEVIKWVIIANIIAWPIAYYFMNNWLQDFAYRVQITFWPFLLSGFVALFLAVLTVSYQSVKAALANPVESLKYE